MSFVKKIWKDRISQFPNRRTINDGYVTKQVTVGRDEGTVTEEGTPFDATEMNDLENRIYAAIEQGGGGGGSAGTYDYTELFNKPRINNHELNGNKSLGDLGIASNANELPIESGSVTNTKDYIDTALSGKADTSDTYTKTEVDNIVAGRKCITYSIITLDTLTSTEQTFNTFGGRKFSDYDLYIFTFGSSDKNFRRTVVLTKSQWQSGANIDEGVLHGASTSTASSYDYCGIVVNYNTDTSIKAKVFGSGSINKFSVIGIKY